MNRALVWRLENWRWIQQRERKKKGKIDNETKCGGKTNIHIKHSQRDIQIWMCVTNTISDDARITERNRVFPIAQRVYLIESAFNGSGWQFLLFTLYNGENQTHRTDVWVQWKAHNIQMAIRYMQQHKPLPKWKMLETQKEHLFDGVLNVKTRGFVFVPLEARIRHWRMVCETCQM